MAIEDSFTADYVRCDRCESPAPFRVWCDGELIAQLCEECNAKWWQDHYSLILDVAQALDVVVDRSKPIAT
jgi:hypothetical protein